ncbi:MAG TPA: PQQ-binding-like beta-propeller repeat protein, partial [Paracoccaceae bacterium]|nr:PQQ-binding-like beta-propeller repeat protein [Paracoccaceae bacterium]
MIRLLRPALAAGLLLAALGGAQAQDSAAVEPGQWLSTGRTWDEQHYSPMDQINAGNVGQLGLTWYADLTTDRGQEATPLVLDGVLYNTEPWNITTAYDATTGRVLWRYDPQVPLRFGRMACCDIVTRGLAAWHDKILIATLDGRLIALDKDTGAELWSTQTTDPTQSYTITGAPRVYDGMVLIGNGGAELGVRGYVSAYAVDTGELLWRWHTVPGNPAEGFENDAMRMAAGTWTGQWWLSGGGGTVWDAISYDPALGMVYIGTGNGSPWTQRYRSPQGGDNLFLASIVALDARTGE